MALIIKTTNPTGLLSAIKKTIDDKTIDTWSYDKDNDFTHVPAQWKGNAWLRPKVTVGSLQFGILGRKDVELTKYIYAVYHGRFAEMLISHFNVNFSEISISPNPIKDIDVTLKLV
jgi:hypothetical protein